MTLAWNCFHAEGCNEAKCVVFSCRLQESFESASKIILLVAPGIATRSKKLVVTKVIATRSKDATSSSWPYY